MKLSEAIRLGAMLKPQGFRGTGSRRCPATCAYGAALDAVSGNALEDFWPWLLDLRGVQCPACSEQDRMGIIPHLNNVHRWTREAIADWVETIEPAQEPKVETADKPAMEPACAVRSEAQS